MLKATRASFWLAGAFSVLGLAGCSAPTITGFNLTAGPANISLAPGGTASINVAATTTSSKPSTAAIIIYNLPVGVSFSPASPTVTTGSQTTIYISAAPSAAAATKQIQVYGYQGLAYSGQTLTLTVTPNP